MPNPNAKHYLATKEMQETTNQSIVSLENTIDTTFKKPSLSEIGDFIVDFFHDEIVIEKGCLNASDRTIIC